MSFIAAFTLVTLCGVVFYCVMIAKQTGDPVNRFSVFGAVAVLLLYIGVTLALVADQRGVFYRDPIEFVLATAAFALLIAQIWRVLRTHRKMNGVSDGDAARRNLPNLLNDLPVQAAFLTPDMTYAFVNDAYSASFGKPASEIEGQHLSQIIPPNLLAEVIANVEKALAGRQVTWHFDFSRPVLARNQGTAIYQPLSDRGQVVGVLVMVMDRSAVQDAVYNAELSATKHALAAEVAGVGYLEWDQEGALVDVSHEVEALLGRDAQSLREMWQQGQGFVEPRSRATIRNNLHMAGSRPRDVIENVKFLAANGRQIEARSCIRRLDRGQDVHLLAAIQDVTDQQHVLDDLVKSETRFRDFTESATDWVWEMDVDRRFTFLSGGGRQTDAETPIFELGKTLAQADIAQGEGDYDVLQQRLARQTPFRDLRLVFPSTDGRERLIDMSGKPFFDSNAQLAGYRGTCFDMTEIVMAETERKSALEALALAFENISTMVALFDSNDRLVYCNEKYRASYAGIGDDIIGRHFDELLEHFTRSDNFTMTSEGKVRWSEQRRDRRNTPAKFFRARSASGRWLEVTDYPVPAGGLLTIVSDITEKVEREERLHRHETALQLLNRRETLGQMTAAIAHELNQPLAAIHNFAAGCVLRAQNDQLEREDMIAVLNNMQSQSERASAILRSMSNYLHNDDADRIAVCFDDILRSVQLLIQPESSASGVSVVMDNQCDGVELHCARIEIEQLLINLIKNAIDASRDAQRADAEVSVSAHCSEGEIVIDVTDDGRGFAPDMPAETAFSAFRSTKEKGLGVGLAICETIVLSHGGTIAVSKSDEQGACLTVRLPLEVQE
ncbi:Sensor protein FixL [Sulfitobacter indolifex]|uniref:histidine kinase n=2 Tax=root TaxID=1 RepID=A0ABP2DHI9_9RHOB|nr:PAS domain S-box protein [Sulfitobacter indolifex]EDQ06850.1 PAS [Sulfitobacter indolifex HEL-45]UOA17833.1 Sensor protein FixL [Sulfitobacter indolifex]